MGAGDCEALAGGLLAQPVLAVTSVAYLVAGILVAIVAGRESRPAGIAYGSTLALVGAGSVAFHGPQPSWGGTGPRPADRGAGGLRGPRRDAGLP